MPGQQNTAPPLPPLPSSSSKSQGCLLTNNPWRQQDGAPRRRGHENAHQETGCGSAPSLAFVGGGGKGCMVWNWLRPSSLWLALNIFSVSHSIGHLTPNCPLPWADVCAICVSSKRCRRGHAVTLPAPWEQWACPHSPVAPAMSSDIALQHPQQLLVPQAL